jgi:hypothetical protein
LEQEKRLSEAPFRSSTLVDALGLFIYLTVAQLMIAQLR